MCLQVRGYSAAAVARNSDAKAARAMKASMPGERAGTVPQCNALYIPVFTCCKCSVCVAHYPNSAHYATHLGSALRTWEQPRFAQGSSYEFGQREGPRTRGSVERGPLRHRQAHLEVGGESASVGGSVPVALGRHAPQDSKVRADDDRSCWLERAPSKEPGTSEGLIRGTRDHQQSGSTVDGADGRRDGSRWSGSGASGSLALLHPAPPPHRAAAEYGSWPRCSTSLGPASWGAVSWTRAERSTLRATPERRP